MAQLDNDNPANDEFPEYDAALGERLADLDETEAEQRTTALRAGLEDYELDDEDLALLDAGQIGEDGTYFLPALPVLAIVGRPNAGKSSLFNAIAGETRTIVSEIAGTTRDAIDSVVDTDIGRFRFIDTAGMRKAAKVTGAFEMSGFKVNFVMHVVLGIEREVGIEINHGLVSTSNEAASGVESDLTSMFNQQRELIAKAS